MAKRSRARVSDDQLAFDLRVKTCPTCKRELAGWDFVQCRGRKNNLSAYCILCSRIRQAKLRESEEFRKRTRERGRAWNRANPERLRKRGRDWYAANKERRRARGLAWSDANRERHRELNREWAKANPDSVRAAWTNYYARKKAAATGPFSTEGMMARWAYYGNKCWICRAEATATDHVKPLAKGGAHMLCNLRPICQPCNSAKRDKWPFTKEMIRCGAA